MLQQFNEKNRDLIVNINGKLVHRDEAGVSPFDSVVQGGDGVWEGLRLYDGKIFKLTEHLDRLRSSALALAFTEIPSHEEIIGEIRRTLEANSMLDGVHIRLTLTRGVKLTSGMDPRLNQAGPTLIILAEHKAPVYDKAGLSLVTSSIRRFPPDCLDPKIHHNNLVQSRITLITFKIIDAFGDLKGIACDRSERLTHIGDQCLSLKTRLIGNTVDTGRQLPRIVQAAHKSAITHFDIHHECVEPCCQLFG